MRWRFVAAFVGLMTLTLAGALSAYQVAFSLWMTAYPKTDINFWRPHLYLRLLQAAVIGIAWIALAIWTVRESAKRRDER